MVSRQALRKTLLATVSAGALVVGAPAIVSAQGASPTWWVEIEGQYSFIDGDVVDFRDFNGENLSLSVDDGWTGRLKVGGKIDADWFIEGGIRYGKSNNSFSSFYYSYLYNAGDGLYGYYGDGDFSYKEDHLVLDLQIGRDIGIGNGGALHAFAGVRFARFNGEGSGSYFYSYNYYGGAYGYGYADVSTKHRFSGFGPRIGIDAMIPVSSNVRIDAGVAGALLYGKRSISIDFVGYNYYDGNINDSYSDKKRGWFPNIEANVALTYMLSPGASISAGYRAEFFGDVMPTVGNFDFGKDDRIIHGPFLRLTISGN